MCEGVICDVCILHNKYGFYVLSESICFRKRIPKSCLIASETDTIRPCWHPPPCQQRDHSSLSLFTSLSHTLPHHPYHPLSHTALREMSSSSFSPEVTLVNTSADLADVQKVHPVVFVLIHDTAVDQTWQVGCCSVAALIRSWNKLLPLLLAGYLHGSGKRQIACSQVCIHNRSRYSEGISSHQPLPLHYGMPLPLHYQRADTYHHFPG